MTSRSSDVHLVLRPMRVADATDAQVEKELERLTAREQQVIRYRYGLSCSQSQPQLAHVRSTTRRTTAALRKLRRSALAESPQRSS